MSAGEDEMISATPFADHVARLVGLRVLVCLHVDAVESAAGRHLNDLRRCIGDAVVSMLDRSACTVALVSARSRADLERWLPSPDERVLYLGRDGLERSAHSYIDLDADEHARLDVLHDDLDTFAASRPGVRVLGWNAGATVTASDPAAACHLSDVVELIVEHYHGIEVRSNARSVEVRLRPLDRAAVIHDQRMQSHCDSIAYFGGDSQDEAIFRSMSTTDVGIGIGVSPWSHAKVRATAAEIPEYLDAVRRVSRQLRPQGQPTPRVS
ncbi:MAG: hypothetical protein AB7L13_12275 [Acidimicrobiia bacterium]